MHIHGGGFIATSSSTHEVFSYMNISKEKSCFYLDLFKTMGIRS
jgi:hypothetical protein